MKNIVLIGMMGCGKSTIGKILSEKMNYNFVDCDDYLENKYNKKISDCFLVSESYFRDLETVCLEELSKSNKNILSTGGGMDEKIYVQPRKRISDKRTLPNVIKRLSK